MIVNEQIITYLHSLEQDNEPLLEDMRAYAAEHGVPIIRREMESFLRVLLRMTRAESVLEIGTGIGFSAVFMALHGAEVREILTYENYPARIEKARENIAAYEQLGLGQAKIRMEEEDACAAVSRLAGPFDLIFLDGPKAQYITMLPELLRILRKDGVLLADNVLQDGELVRSRFVTQRRERTIHERMREFLWEVKHHPQLETAVIPIGDGVSVSMKK